MNLLLRVTLSSQTGLFQCSRSLVPVLSDEKLSHETASEWRSDKFSPILVLRQKEWETERDSEVLPSRGIHLPLLDVDFDTSEVNAGISFPHRTSLFVHPGHLHQITTPR